MTRVAAPALVVIVVVAALVGIAGWNRSGPPRGVLTLTERELQLPWEMEVPEEDRGRQLLIGINRRDEPLDALNWLPESRLRAIGFPFSVTAGAPEAADTYAKTPPRLAWVAFELEGPVWRDLERRRALQRGLESEFPNRRRLQSRLVPVDAAPELDELQIRYPSGHLILRAVIDIHFLPPDRGGPLVYGSLRRIVPSHLAVPREMRSVLDSLAADADVDPAAPRYEAEVAVGRLGIPYVRNLRPTHPSLADLKNEERRTKN